jgi:site-specific DNA recombinase
MTRRAALYARISQDREGAGLGVDRQRADCRALAKKLGWPIVVEHTDNDMSAYSGKRRPGYRELLDDIGTKRVDAVIVWHTDRLHRSPRELEEYVDLCERHGVVTQTVKAGELDLATPSGRAVARTLGAWARFEVEHKSERTKRAQLQAAEAGKWLGGGRPFGWQCRDDGSAIMDRKEAREIRRASEALLAGASLGSIVADLNRRGITTSTGRTWNYSSLRQVLSRARNAGISTYHRKIVGASAWPAIVSEDTWRSVCALLADPSRRRSSSNRARWLMAGLALCGTCGERLRSATVVSNRAQGTTRTVYRCPTPGIGHVARAAPIIDAYISAIVVERLQQPDILSALAADRGVDTSELRAERVALRARQNEAAESFADGNITGSQLSRISTRLTKRLDDIEAQLASSSRGNALVSLAGPHAEELWIRAPIDRQRAVVTELLTATVLPSGRRGKDFDPELVRVEWKGSLR